MPRLRRRRRGARLTSIGPFTSRIEPRSLGGGPRNRYPRVHRPHQGGWDGIGWASAGGTSSVAGPGADQCRSPVSRDQELVRGPSHRRGAGEGQAQRQDGVRGHAGVQGRVPGIQGGPPPPP